MNSDGSSLFQVGSLHANGQIPFGLSSTNDTVLSGAGASALTANDFVVV